MMKQQNIEFERLALQPPADPQGFDAVQPVEEAGTAATPVEQSEQPTKRVHTKKTGVKGRDNRIIDPDADRRTPAIKHGWIPREHRIGHTLAYLSEKEAEQVQGQQTDPDFEGPTLPSWLVGGEGVPKGNTYTPETKLAVFHRVVAGMTAKEIKQELNLSEGGINGWRNEAIKQGLLPPRTGIGEVTKGWGDYTGEMPRSDHSYQGLPKRPKNEPRHVPKAVVPTNDPPSATVVERSVPTDVVEKVAPAARTATDTRDAVSSAVDAPSDAVGFGSISVRIVGDRVPGQAREIMAVKLDGSKPGLPSGIRHTVLAICSLLGDGAEPFEFVHDGLGSESLTETWVRLAIEVASKVVRPVNVVYPGGSVHVPPGML